MLPRPRWPRSRRSWARSSASLGPNGPGKSTAPRLMLASLRRTPGSPGTNAGATAPRAAAVAYLPGSCALREHDVPPTRSSPGWWARLLMSCSPRRSTSMIRGCSRALSGMWQSPFAGLPASAAVLDEPTNAPVDVRRAAGPAPGAKPAARGFLFPRTSSPRSSRRDRVGIPKNGKLHAPSPTCARPNVPRLTTTTRSCRRNPGVVAGAS